MTGGGYELLHHTADMRARLSATDVDNLYDLGARLMREVFVGDSDVAAADERTVELSAADEAERFFRFLRELLYMYDADGFLAAEVADGGRVLRGEGFDPERHASEHQLKAVTRHGYRFEKENGRYDVEVVFDV